MRMNPTLTVPALLLAGASLGVLPPAARRDSAEDALHVVPPRDAIPAISDPEFEPVSKAGLADHELVIGVGGEGEQRAYSTWQLDRHEIVNDTFEGRTIAVTW